MRAVKIAVALVVVVAAVVTLLFVGIPVGFLAGPIQTQVEIDTGYQLKISGSTRLIVLPSPSVSIGSVSLSDVGKQPFVTVENLRVAASLQSLFSGRPQITELVMTRPVFRAPLIRQRAAQPARQPSGTVTSPKSGQPVTIDHFAIYEGALHFVNANDVIESKLEKIELVGALTADDQLDMIVAARAGEQNLALKIKGAVPRGGFDGRPIPVQYGFDAPGMLAPLSGSAEVRADGTLIRINSITGSLGPNKFSGWASVDVASKPLVRVDLDFQSVDIGAAHVAGTGSGPGAPPSNIDAPWSDAPLNLDTLNYFDADVKISAAALKVDTLHFAPITINTTIDNGIVRVATPQVGLYGGQASGGFAFDVSGAEPVWALRLDVLGVRALPLLADATNFTAVDGQMQARIDLRARGGSERAIMSSLEGTLDLSFQNGELRSVNIAQMIRNVGASVLSGWQAGQSEKTDFTQLSAQFRFDRGQATTSNLQLAGPLMRVTGAGTADVGAKTLQFKLDPKLVMSLEGQGSTAANPVGLGVPVMVQGTWGQPKIYPEFAGMLENPDAAFAKLKEMGLGLFGNTAGGQQSGSSAGAGSLIQGIGDILKNLGNNPGGGQPPATPRR